SFYVTSHHLNLHSTPTRRSADLSNSREAFHRDGRAAARTVTDGGQSQRAVVAAQRVQERHDDPRPRAADRVPQRNGPAVHVQLLDRKSTRLNSSHVKSSYAVFCL